MGENRSDFDTWAKPLSLERCNAEAEGLKPDSALRPINPCGGQPAGGTFPEHERLAARTHKGRENMKAGLIASYLLTVLLVGAIGCKVKVDKSGDGDNVKIATPFGGIAVKKDQTSAADLGLPAYPGAVMDGAGE